MKYLPLDTNFLVSVVVTPSKKGGVMLHRVAEYLCFTMKNDSNKYRSEVERIYKHFYKLRRGIHFKKQPMTEEKYKKVRQEVSIYSCDKE